MRTTALLLSVVASVSACKGASDCADLLPDACPSPKPTYSDQVAPLIQKHCLTCHGPGGAQYPSRDFTTYEKVFAQRVDILSQVNSCLMPPYNGPELNDDDRKTLLGWFVCDAPQN